MKRTRFVWLAFPVALLLLAAAANVRAETNANLPEGPGLAAQYPGDEGIGEDDRVLLVENFEHGDLDALSARWDSVSNEDGNVLAFSDDVPPASSGGRSLQMTATLGENTGGHLYTRLPTGVERAFLRFYVKFAEEAPYIHHFVHLGGYRPATPFPQGGAGSRPEGHERFTVGIEPHGQRGGFEPPGTWVFYAYWSEMKASAGRYWGNALIPAEPEQIPRDQWLCVEIMLQCNSAPDRRDGQLALWLDGELEMHIAPGVRRGPWSGMGFQLTDNGGEPFEGFLWRTDEDLNINFLWLLHYVTESAARQNRDADPNPINRVWFDHIVVSTDYIGPIQPKP